MYSLKVGTTTARHTIAGRAVYVRVTPRTRNINEGRQVLRELERFGPVEMFRSLKYDPETQSPNAALAIYQHTASARQLLDASPIRYTLNPPGGDEDKQVYSALAATWEEEGDLWKAAGIEQATTREESATEREAPETDPQTRFPPPTNPTLPYRSPWGSSPSPSTATPPNNPTFTLVASLSNLDHAAYISRQPYYGPYRPLADPVHSSRIWRDERRSGRMRSAPALGKVWKEGLSGNAEKGEDENSQRKMGDGLVRRVPE